MPSHVLLSSIAGWLGLCLAVGAGIYHTRGAEPRRMPWVAWLLLGTALLFFRWPVLSLPHELHPDESQLLAGAITLRHDPLFWRSVDGNTAGPLDIYALLPAVFFPGSNAYVAARVIAALLIWGALVAAGESLVLLTGRPAARGATLPALLFAAFTTSPEFVPYSTEQVPALLLALAVLALARREIQATRANLWGAALLLGAIPWAKLQAIPLAVALGLWLVVREWQAGRRAATALLVAAAAVPTLVVLLVLTFTAQTDHMIFPYILQNLLYTGTGRLPLTTVLLQHGQQALTNGYLAAWLAGSAIVGLVVALALRRASLAARRHVLVAAGLVLGAGVCVLAPGRPYGHYLHFLAMPLTVLLGTLLAAVAEFGPVGRKLMIFCGLCLLVPPVALRLSSRTDPYANYNTVLTAPDAEHRELTARVQAFARPGETLGVWGWRSSLYVETGLAQATSVAQSEPLLIAGPAQTYYLHRYAENLAQAAPPVFVDAVGPGNFRFQARELGHEMFPWLRDWIAANYTLVADLDGTRLYVRNDRVKPGGSS